MSKALDDEWMYLDVSCVGVTSQMLHEQYAIAEDTVYGPTATP